MIRKIEKEILHSMKRIGKGSRQNMIQTTLS